MLEAKRTEVEKRAMLKQRAQQDREGSDTTISRSYQ